MDRCPFLNHLQLFALQELPRTSLSARSSMASVEKICRHEAFFAQANSHFTTPDCIHPVSPWAMESRLLDGYGFLGAQGSSTRQAASDVPIAGRSTTALRMSLLYPLLQTR